MPGDIRRAFIVVRTYPVPAVKGVEVSCTAAITDKGEWLRLFPVPYRRLHQQQQFHKYQWIEVEVIKATDPRPESHKIRQETISIKSSVLETDREWSERKKIVLPLLAESMCALQREQKATGSPTLGIVRPAEIHRLVIEPTADEWTEAQRAILTQGDLFETEAPELLEKIPFDFRYEFTCSDPNCNGHSMKCTDWELGQLWRNCRRGNSDSWEHPFRQRAELEMIHKYDTHFYVGTIHQHPNSWIIVGLFYPPKSTLPLFPD